MKVKIGSKEFDSTKQPILVSLTPKEAVFRQIADGLHAEGKKGNEVTIGHRLCAHPPDTDFMDDAIQNWITAAGEQSICPCSYERDMDYLMRVLDEVPEDQKALVGNDSTPAVILVARIIRKYVRMCVLIDKAHSILKEKEVTLNETHQCDSG